MICYLNKYRQSISKQKEKRGEIQNMSQPSSRGLWLTAGMIESTVSEKKKKKRSLLAWTVNMLVGCFIFIHLEVTSVWALVMKDWHSHTHNQVGWLKKEKQLTNYTAFCLSLQKAEHSLVGIWPDVFPVVLYCRMWWRVLCPVVVVLARAPLTRWLRRWNMLIKLKTTGKNLHQVVTLVVSGATVRLIYGETCTRWHACLSVCEGVFVRWCLCAVFARWICVIRPASWC